VTSDISGMYEFPEEVLLHLYLQKFYVCQNFLKNGLTIIKHRKGSRRLENIHPNPSAVLNQKHK